MRNRSKKGFDAFQRFMASRERASDAQMMLLDVLDPELVAAASETISQRLMRVQECVGGFVDGDAGGGFAAGGEAHEREYRPPPAVVRCLFGKVRSLPPVGNTGVGVAVGIGNLRFSLPLQLVKRVADEFCVLSGCDGELRHGHSNYHTCLRWDCGFEICSGTAVGASNEGRCLVVVDQSFLELLEFDELCYVFWFFERLLALSFKFGGLPIVGICTRIDPNVDFPESMLSLDAVAACHRAGNFTGYRSSREIDDRRRGRVGETRRKGHTVYFGARGKRGGGAFGRFYRKDLERGYGPPLVRVETEFSKSNGFAGQVFKLCCDAMRRSEDDYRRFVFSTLRMISFVEADGLPCSWWSSIICGVDKFELVRTRALPDKVRAFVRRKSKLAEWVAVVAAIATREGRDFMRSVDEFVRSIISSLDVVGAERVHRAVDELRGLGFTTAHVGACLDPPGF